MNKRKTFLTAIVVAVGLAPISAWSQEVPPERNQPSPGKSRPGAGENVPGTRESAPQELSQNDMRLIEQALQDKGYSPGTIDGMADDTARAAIRKFQQDNALPVTGRIDERTANQLGFRYSKSPSGRSGTGSDQPAPSKEPSQR